MWGQTKGNETNATINQSQKEYLEKIQGYCHYKFIPSMSELVAINPIEDIDEGMVKIIRAASYAFKALKDDYLMDPERSD